MTTDLRTLETAAAPLPGARVPVQSGYADFDHAAFDALLDDFAAGSAARDRDRILPFAEIAALKALRFGAYRLPKADGGTGASVRRLFEQVIRLGAADSNIAHILRNHFVFVERFAHGDGPQNRFWRAEVARGAIFGLANADKGKGHPPARLTPDGTGWRLSGEKFYSTGTLYADHVVVRAALPDGTAAAAILPTDRRGIALIDDWDSAGQRLTGSGTTLLEAVGVSAAEVVIDGAQSPYDAPYKSTLPQLFLTAVNAGILQAVLRDAKALLRSRRGRNFYFAPADSPEADPIFLKTLGDLASWSFAAESVVLAAAEAQDRLDRQGPAGDRALAEQGALLAAKAKVVVDRLTTDAAGRLFDLGGASSTQREHNLDRHWRNARTLASHNPAPHKAFAIGDHELNGTPVPERGFF